MKRVLYVFLGVFVTLATVSPAVAQPQRDSQDERRGRPGERGRDAKPGDRPEGRPGRRPGQNDPQGPAVRGQDRQAGDRPGQAGQGGPAGGGQGRGGQGRGMQQMDPARVAARMLETFDKDGDSKLDANELTALLAAMRDGRGGMGRGGMSPEEIRSRRMDAMRGGRDGDQKAGDTGSQRRRGAGGKSRSRGGDIEGAEAGGDRPKRPASSSNGSQLEV